MKISILMFFSLFMTKLSWAQVNSSSASLASGGTGRAAIVPEDINFLNPATLTHSHGRNFYFQSTANLISVGLSEGPGDIIMPASVAYLQDSRSLKSQNRNAKLIETDLAKVKDVSLALADLVYNKVSFGISLHRYSITWPDQFRLSAHDQNFNRSFLDLGFIFTPRENIGLGLVFNNIAGGENYNLRQVLLRDPIGKNLSDEVIDSFIVQSQIGFGFQYLYQNQFRVRTDLLSGPNQTTEHSSLMVGFDNFLNQWLVFRVGFQHNGIREANLVSTGLAFEGPRFQISYGFQQDVEDDAYSKHSVDLAFPF